MLRLRNEIPGCKTPEEAHEIQTRLARELRRGDQFKYVAGADVAYSKDDEHAYAVAVVLSTSNWKSIAEQRAVLSVPASYDPEMLGWREGPSLLEVLLQLPIEPDLILVNGNGIAHPRKFGLACHVGYALDHPTVGITKTWPPGCGGTSAMLPKRRGSKIALFHDPSRDHVGFEVYTQDNIDPIYVSPGNRVSVEDAVSLALRCAPWYRMPEPLRRAEEAVSEFRKNKEGT